ncbi:MFS transporter [Kerstersia gyiorum]|uniref:Putative tartrate transporter n=1 Tax=Kerstersia gyiorum TaxID=206506 RepID=A0A171KWL7_9BURK|nr:MFS transporter [Kerstersia gyiorum]MCO7635850.1 MFS transporter [Pseudomonas sp. S 311-6]KAB0544907.1 MFS transporter [Kerstersia gyiorum]KKO73284.1 MFS transporter permease [Kerstersia gyiorum]MCP1632156.1 D-galactonate transporter [Kerstersia gyiorum]MCP1635337.1 D-galactonate transporter [Kerstersia gyiorum]
MNQSLGGVATPGIAAASATSAATDNTLYRKVAWRLLPFLMACYIAAFLDRVNVGFAKLQMLDDLQFSEAVYGLGAGIFFIGYFLFEVPSNVLMHRIGAKKTLARIMVLWGLISAAMALTQTPTQFYILRFLLGAAEAGFYPGIILYLTYWFPSHRRGQIVAVFMTAVPFAGILGGPLSGWIMEAFHETHNLAGWQWMFLIEAVPSLLLGVAVLWYLDDRIDDARWLSPEEKARLNGNLSAERATKTEHVSLLRLFRDRRVVHMALICYCTVSSLSGLAFWIPSVIRSTGVSSLLDVGLLTAIPNICAVISMILVCRHSDRSRERRWHMIIPFLVGGTGLALSTLFSHNPMLAVAMLSVAAAGCMVCSPLFWSLPTAFLDGKSAAAGIAGINSFAGLAAFVSPYAIGWIKELTGSTDGGMYFLASFTVLGAILVYRVPRELVNR